MPEVDGWWDEPAVLFASVLLCLLGRWLALELMEGTAVDVLQNHNLRLLAKHIAGPMLDSDV